MAVYRCPGLGQDGVTMSKRLLILTLAFFTLVIALGAWSYRFAITDDAFISLRYSERLLEGKGLTWNDGERVEGYSNLLWVLLCAALGLMGIELVLAAQIGGLLCTLGLLPVYIAAFPLGRSFMRALPALTALAFFCSSPAVLHWAVGGLEQPLAMLLLGLGLTFMLGLFSERGGKDRQALCAGVCFGLMALTRPDVVLFGGLAALLYPLLTRFGHGALRHALLIGLPVALCYGGQLAFRYWYYDALVPNTALIKLSLNERFVKYGLRYLGLGSARFAALILTALVGVVACWRLKYQREMALLLAVQAIAWCGYMTMMGGDVNWLWRHFLPAVVLWCFLAALLVRAVAERGTKCDQRDLLIVLPFALLLHLFLQWQDVEAHVAGNQDPAKIPSLIARANDLGSGETIGTFLNRAFRDEQPLVALDNAGGVPFYSKLPSLDMLGLNDSYIARNPSRPPGSGFIGHDIGNGAYVLRRQPDLIFFCGAGGIKDPCFWGGKEMLATPEFHESYINLQLFIPKLDWPLSMWTRRESAKVGIRRAPDLVIIPGYLFANEEPLNLELSADGKLLTTLASDQRVRLKDLSLLPGRWRAAVEPAASGARVEPEDLETSIETPRVTLVLENTGATPARVESVKIVPTAGPVAEASPAPEPEPPSE